MILRAGSLPETLRESARFGQLSRTSLSEVGGLSQFGAHLETLAPGATSSQRHWHSAEDELLLVLDGTLTVIDAEGAHTLAPGDCALWPAGEPDAHHCKNLSTAPATYLIVGTSAPRDICTYPDEQEAQHREGRDWTIVDSTGTVTERGRF